MTTWLHWAILTLLAWGVWGLCPKLAVQYIRPDSAVFYEAIGAAIGGIIFVFWFGVKPEFDPKGAFWGLMIGFFGLLGGLFYLYMSRATTATTAVIASSLYPVVTVALAVIVLRENVSVRHVLAFVLALTSLALIATGDSKSADPTALTEQK